MLPLLLALLPLAVLHLDAREEERQWWQEARDDWWRRAGEAAVRLERRSHPETWAEDAARRLQLGIESAWRRGDRRPIAELVTAIERRLQADGQGAARLWLATFRTPPDDGGAAAAASAPTTATATPNPDQWQIATRLIPVPGTPATAPRLLRDAVRDLLGHLGAQEHRRLTRRRARRVQRAGAAPGVPSPGSPETPTDGDAGDDLEMDPRIERRLDWLFGPGAFPELFTTRQAGTATWCHHDRQHGLLVWQVLRHRGQVVAAFIRITPAHPPGMSGSTAAEPPDPTIPALRLALRHWREPDLWPVIIRVPGDFGPLRDTAGWCRLPASLRGTPVADAIASWGDGLGLWPRTSAEVLSPTRIAALASAGNPLLPDEPTTARMQLGVGDLGRILSLGGWWGRYHPLAPPSERATLVVGPPPKPPWLPVRSVATVANAVTLLATLLLLTFRLKTGGWPEFRVRTTLCLWMVGVMATPLAVGFGAAVNRSTTRTALRIRQQERELTMLLRRIEANTKKLAREFAHRGRRILRDSDFPRRLVTAWRGGREPTHLVDRIWRHFQRRYRLTAMILVDRRQRHIRRFDPGWPAPRIRAVSDLLRPVIAESFDARYRTAPVSDEAATDDGTSADAASASTPAGVKERLFESNPRYRHLYAEDLDQLEVFGEGANQMLNYRCSLVVANRLEVNAILLWDWPEELRRRLRLTLPAMHLRHPQVALAAWQVTGGWPEPVAAAGNHRGLGRLAAAARRQPITWRTRSHLQIARFSPMMPGFLLTARVPLDAVAAEAAGDLTWVVLVAIILLAIGLGIIGLLADWIAEPLEGIARTLASPADGRQQRRPMSLRRDEIGDLVAALDHMGERLTERDRLGRLVPPAVLDLVAAGDPAAAMAGRARDVTVLCSDIRDFTSISERYPADATFAALNGHLGAMAMLIHEQGGAIDRFIGDAVVATFFDAPGQAAGPARAMAAASAMITAHAQLQRQRRLANEFTFGIGIGIATGQVMAGVLGDPRHRLDFTVIGDVTARAAALESASKQGRHSRIVVERDWWRRFVPDLPVEALPGRDDVVEVVLPHSAPATGSPSAGSPGEGSPGAANPGDQAAMASPNGETRTITSPRPDHEAATPTESVPRMGAGQERESRSLPGAVQAAHPPLPEDPAPLHCAKPAFRAAMDGGNGALPTSCRSDRARGARRLTGPVLAMLALILVVLATATESLLAQLRQQRLDLVAARLDDDVRRSEVTQQPRVQWSWWLRTHLHRALRRGLGSAGRREAVTMAGAPTAAGAAQSVRGNVAVADRASISHLHLDGSDRSDPYPHAWSLPVQAELRWLAQRYPRLGWHLAVAPWGDPRPPTVGEMVQALARPPIEPGSGPAAIILAPAARPGTTDRPPVEPATRRRQPGSARIRWRAGGNRQTWAHPGCLGLMPVVWHAMTRTPVVDPATARHRVAVARLIGDTVSDNFLKALDGAAGQLRPVHLDGTPGLLIFEPLADPVPAPMASFTPPLAWREAKPVPPAHRQVHGIALLTVRGGSLPERDLARVMADNLEDWGAIAAVRDRLTGERFAVGSDFVAAGGRTWVPPSPHAEPDLPLRVATGPIGAHLTGFDRGGDDWLVVRRRLDGDRFEVIVGRRLPPPGGAEAALAGVMRLAAWSAPWLVALMLGAAVTGRTPQPPRLRTLVTGAILLATLPALLVSSLLAERRWHQQRHQTFASVRQALEEHLATIETGATLVEALPFSVLRPALHRDPPTVRAMARAGLHRGTIRPVHHPALALRAAAFRRGTPARLLDLFAIDGSSDGYRASETADIRPLTETLGTLSRRAMRRVYPDVAPVVGDPATANLTADEFTRAMRIMFTPQGTARAIIAPSAITRLQWRDEIWGSWHRWLRWRGQAVANLGMGFEEGDLMTPVIAELTLADPQTTLHAAFRGAPLFRLQHPYCLIRPASRGPRGSSFMSLDSPAEPGIDLCQLLAEITEEPILAPYDPEDPEAAITVLARPGAARDWIVGATRWLGPDLSRLATERHSTWLLLLAIALTSSWLGRRTATRFLAPLLDLAAAAGSVGRGDFSVSLPVDRADELGMLAASFNRMVSATREAERLRQFVSTSARRAATVEAERSDDRRAAGCGRHQDLVVMFVSMVGFDRWRAHRTAATVMAGINRHLPEVVDAVRQHGGDIDKFIGERVLAVFGSGDPRDLPAAAAAAIRTAATLRQRVAGRAHPVGGAGPDGLPDRLGIGITAGTVLAGLLGRSDVRLEYTVIGDVVNSAARLTDLALARPGGAVLAVSRVRELLATAGEPDLADLLLVEPEVRVKGRQGAIAVCRLADRASASRW